MLQAKVTIPFREWRRLRRRALAAQQRGNFEVAGLFGADQKGRILLVFVKDNDPKPAHFEIDWPEYRQARKTLRNLGARFWGLFHSHPVGYTELGDNDIRWSRRNAFHLIYDVCGSNARMWKLKMIKGKITPTEIPLRIVRTSCELSRRRR